MEVNIRKQYCFTSAHNKSSIFSSSCFNMAARGERMQVGHLCADSMCGLKPWSLRGDEMPFLIVFAPCFSIKVGWYWATVQFSFFFFFISARLSFDPPISCKICLLSQLYCALILAFYITWRHMADPCVLSSADGCSKVIRFGCRDWVIKLTKQPWRMRQQKLSLFYSIIFRPRLVLLYSPKRLWYPPSPSLSALKPQSLSRSQPLFHSRSFSLSHTIALLSPGPVWCWHRSGAVPSPFLSLSLFPLKIHPKLFIYFSPGRGSLIARPSKLVPSVPFFLDNGSRLWSVTTSHSEPGQGPCDWHGPL